MPRKKYEPIGPTQASHAKNMLCNECEQVTRVPDWHSLTLCQHCGVEATFTPLPDPPFEVQAYEQAKREHGRLLLYAESVPAGTFMRERADMMVERLAGRLAAAAERLPAGYEK